jgi:hypothetical protein
VIRAGTPRRSHPSGVSGRSCSRTSNSGGSLATHEPFTKSTSIKSRRRVRSSSQNEVSFIRTRASRLNGRKDPVALDSATSGAGATAPPALRPSLPSLHRSPARRQRSPTRTGEYPFVLWFDDWSQWLRRQNFYGVPASAGRVLENKTAWNSGTRHGLKQELPTRAAHASLPAPT